MVEGSGTGGCEGELKQPRQWLWLGVPVGELLLGVTSCQLRQARPEEG